MNETDNLNENGNSLRNQNSIESMDNSQIPENSMLNPEQNNHNNKIIVEYKKLIFPNIFSINIFIIVPFLLAFIYLNFDILKALIAILFYTMLCAIGNLLFLCLSEKGLIFTKFDTKNILEIKHINYLGCSIKKENTIILENVHFDCKKHKKNKTLNLYIYNDFKNSKEIDLDKVCNIEKKPVKLFYLFTNLINEVDEEHLKQKLNIFINSPLLYESPLFSKEEKILPINYKKVIKMSDIFYTYYFDYFGKPIEKYKLCLIAFILEIYIFLTFYFKFSLRHKIFVIIIQIVIIFIAILFIVARYSMERIDVIYSKDFNKVFIGILNGLANKYDNYINLKKSDVIKFNLKEKNSKKHILKIILVGGSSIDFCEINNQYVDDKFRELINLLNNKFDINNSNNNYNIDNNNT